MSEVKPEPVKVRCPECNKKLGFPPQAVGKKAKCPACAHVFKVAAPLRDPTAAGGVHAAGSARVVPPSPPPRVDEDNSLLALAAVEESAPEVEMSAEEAARAQALAAAKTAAHQAALAGTPAPPPIPERTRGTRRTSVGNEGGAGIDRMPSAVGMLTKGCLFGAGGALIGSFLWVGVAKAVGLELGYVAWAVGLLAGAGMQVGMRAQTNIGGILAAVFAVAGIFVGKVMVVDWVLFPEIAKELVATEAKMESSTKYQQDTLISAEYQKLLKERKLAEEESSEEKLQQARQDATNRVKGWSADKLHTEFTKYKATQPSVEQTLKDLPTGFFAVIAAVFSFGLSDILFVILATVSAFVIGSGRTFNAGSR